LEFRHGFSVPEPETSVTSIEILSNTWELGSLATIGLLDEPKGALMILLSRAVHSRAPSNLGWTPKVLSYLV
jgi:hypothetical protein